jgi:phospholipid transport system substrate-binding protein
LTVAAAMPLMTARHAFAATEAENFVAQNIQRGFDILNDAALSAAERRTRFAAFLLDLTDLRRVALFLLGRYAQGASAAQIDAFVAAFRDYSMAIYQSYFAQYAGQTLKVTGSHQRAPGDDVVTTTLGGAGQAPMEVDFRVRSDGAKPVLVDIAVAGVWLALAQHDEFAAVLSRSNGDIAALIQHLRSAQALFR